MRHVLFASLAALALASCSNGAGPQNDSEPDNGVIENVAIAADWPASLTVVGDGYPNPGDACRRVGESAATSNWLDDSADLVGCPTAQAAAALGGKVVATVDGITLVSIPRDRAAMEENGPPPPPEAAAGGDPIRKAGGLEDQCNAKVAATVGAPVLGTNRVEEKGDAFSIFFNVSGAQAPWRCFGTKSGGIAGVEYAGDEGRL